MSSGLNFFRPKVFFSVVNCSTDGHGQNGKIGISLLCALGMDVAQDGMLIKASFRRCSKTLLLHFGLSLAWQQLAGASKNRSLLKTGSRVSSFENPTFFPAV